MTNGGESLALSNIERARKAFMNGGGKLLKDYLNFRLFEQAFSLNVEFKNCDLNCEHCYYHRDLNWCKHHPDIIQPEKARIITIEEYEKLFRQYIGKSVVLTGGEPLLPEYSKIVQLAYSLLGSGCIVITNGTHELPINMWTRFFVSLDGPETIHEFIRRKKGIYKIIEKNIRGDKRVILAPTLSTTNYLYIEELVRIAREWGLKITFSLYTPNIEDVNDPLYLTGEKLEYTVNTLKKVLRENRDIVYLTESMIDLFQTKAHWKNCTLRDGWVDSRDPNLVRKRPCVIGRNVDCSRCGCIIPVIMHALKHALLTFNPTEVADVVRVAKMFSYTPPKEETKLVLLNK